MYVHLNPGQFHEVNVGTFGARPPSDVGTLGAGQFQKQKVNVGTCGAKPVSESKCNYL